METGSKYSQLPAVKVLWINPLGTAVYDGPMADVIRQIKEPGTTVEVVSLPGSLDNVEYRAFEAHVVRETVELTRYAAVNHFDGVVIACFYDPALLEAREISGEAIVAAPCEASLQVVTRLCNRFSVIVGQAFWAEQMTQRVREYGLEHKLASMQPIDCPVRRMQAEPERTRKLIAAAGKRAIEEDGAEALILGCTAEFGFFRELQDTLGVPVIDPVFAAFKSCEFAAGLKAAYGWKPSRVGSSQPPSEEDIARFGLFSGPAPIANRVSVGPAR